MSVGYLKRFAQSLVREAELVGETYDGTVGSTSFRERVATLYYGLGVFRTLTNLTPAEYLARAEQEENGGER